MKSKRVKKTCHRKAVSLLAVILACSFGITGCQDEKVLENQKAYRQVGINKMNEGDYAAAVDAFQKALDLSQAEVGEMELDICYYKATAQYNSGDTKGAVTTCNALVDYNKKDSRAYFIRGCIYLKEGDSDKAKKDFDKALDFCGNNYALYLSVYENLAGAGFTQEAEELMAKGLKLKGDQPEDYRERGHIYLIRGDYDNARKELDQAINKGDTKALLYLAQVYDAQNDAKKASSLYESYLKKNGSDVAVMTNLAEMQMEAGKYQKALEMFQTALKADNIENEKQLRRNEIICYENLLDFAAAKEKMASYIKDFPEDKEAQREHVFLQTR
ncbi:MAG: tetratricopeptide repeat protein [Lachnospiraceae bacterium]|nr:tetratricopeptide repeat protein [Lachnospiraceae bacterium]